MTKSITAEDHSDRHHVTEITMTQQQPGNPEPAGEFNQANRQNHEMIDIEELLNDWLEEAV